MVDISYAKKHILLYVEDYLMKQRNYCAMHIINNDDNADISLEKMKALDELKEKIINKIKEI